MQDVPAEPSSGPTWPPFLLYFQDALQSCTSVPKRIRCPRALVLCLVYSILFLGSQKIGSLEWCWHIDFQWCDSHSCWTKEGSGLWANSCPLPNLYLELCPSLCSLLPAAGIWGSYPIPSARSIPHVRHFLRWLYLSPLRTETVALQWQWDFFLSPVRELTLCYLSQLDCKPCQMQTSLVKMELLVSPFVSSLLVAVCGRPGHDKYWKRSYSRNVVIMDKEVNTRHVYNMCSLVFMARKQIVILILLHTLVKSCIWAIINEAQTAFGRVIGRQFLWY